MRSVTEDRAESTIRRLSNSEVASVPANIAKYHFYSNSNRYNMFDTIQLKPLGNALSFTKTGIFHRSKIHFCGGKLNPKIDFCSRMEKKERIITPFDNFGPTSNNIVSNDFISRLIDSLISGSPAHLA